MYLLGYVELHFTLGVIFDNIWDILISSIPSNAGLSPGTTKNMMNLYFDFVPYSDPACP